MRLAEKCHRAPVGGERIGLAIPRDQFVLSQDYQRVNGDRIVSAFGECPYCSAFGRRQLSKDLAAFSPSGRMFDGNNSTFRGESPYRKNITLALSPFLGALTDWLAIARHAGTKDYRGRFHLSGVDGPHRPGGPLARLRPVIVECSRQAVLPNALPRKPRPRLYVGSHVAESNFRVSLP